MIEGSQDEAAFVPEIQRFLILAILLKAGAGFGITSKATDFASEVGSLAIPSHQLIKDFDFVEFSLYIGDSEINI